MMEGAALTPRLSPTVLQGWRLHAARIGWLLVAASLLILYIVQLDEHWRNFQANYFFYDMQLHDSYPAVAGLLSRRQFALYVLAMQLLATAACLVLGVILAWRRHDDWMVLLVALTLIWAPLGFGLVGYADTYLAVSWRYWQLLRLLRLFAGTAGMSALVLLFLVFPDGRFAPSWMKWTLVPLALLVVIGTLGLEALAPTGLTWEALMGSLLALLVLAVAAQIYRYRNIATEAQRQQTRAVVLVLALLPAWMIAALFAEPFIAPYWRPVFNIIQLHLGMLIPLLIPLTLGYAALRYQLWDVAPLVRRTVLYTVLTLCVAGVYVLVVGAAASALRIENNLLLTVMMTGLVALLAHPLRRRMQQLVNRFLYGERDAPAAVLARLGERLEATAAADQVLPAITATLGQALKLPYVAVALSGDKDGQPAAVYQLEIGANGGEEAAGLPLHSHSGSTRAWPGLVKTPLYYQRRQIGELWTAPRSPREQLAPADLALIEQVAQHAGPAVHAARLAADLQQSREQIVLAAEEERRRLHRDLHDGLGPQLASLGLRIDAARNWLARDSTKTEALLVELQQQVQAAVADVRRIVYDLRPAALDQLGLAAAIRQYAERAGGERLQVTVDLPPALPPLDAAVEVAAYRIVLEALANSVQHADARRCRVTICADDTLTLEIADDGRGLPAAIRPGLGLRSMRERAAAVGGTFALEQTPGGGACVRVELPLASSAR